jgi:hypothetical protein
VAPQAGADVRGEAKVVSDPRHGETLVVTYYVRRRQVERMGLEHVVAFLSKDIVRRVLSWKGGWV